MVPQQDHDRHVDAIDLTLSSPEPDVKSQPQAPVSRQLQQQQPARRTKQEPGNSYTSAHNDSRRQASTSSGNVAHQQARRIDPYHVKQIVDTSSHKALKYIVLQLCKSSPALSGAIARGLMPHSPWAQALIRGQQDQPQARRQPQPHQLKPKSEPKSEPSWTELVTQERSKRRFGSSNTAQGSNPSVLMQESATRPNVHRPTAEHQNSDGLRLPQSSRKPPAVKREHQASLTDSDDSNDIVDFPARKRETPRRERQQRTTASSSSGTLTSAHHGAEGLTVRQRSTLHDASDHKLKLCVQCGELIMDDDMNCCYHPGCQIPVRPGDVRRYNCCGKFITEPGCSFGRHVSAKTGLTTNSKRPSPSPHGGLPWFKKPRVL